MNYVMKEAQYYLEAVVQRCSVKEVFLEISQNSQENTCTRVSFLIKLQASFLHRTPLVAASYYLKSKFGLEELKKQR